MVKIKSNLTQKSTLNAQVLITTNIFTAGGFSTIRRQLPARHTQTRRGRNRSHGLDRNLHEGFITISHHQRTSQPGIVDDVSYLIPEVLYGNLYQAGFMPVPAAVALPEDPENKDVVGICFQHPVCSDIFNAQLALCQLMEIIGEPVNGMQDKIQFRAAGADRVALNVVRYPSC